MNDWRAAWEIHKDAAAEAAHVHRMQTKQSHGFADHPFNERGISGFGFHKIRCCDLPIEKHHSDMIPFADLSAEIKAYAYETAIIGFKSGYEAGVQAALDEMDARGMYP